MRVYSRVFVFFIDMIYQSNIIEEVQNNDYFRKVLFTGKKSQFVVMSIPPGESIGMETHLNVEQALFFASGTGRAILDGKPSPVLAGDVVIVPPGISHDFVNTGSKPLKIYTIYSPANHIDGRIHQTKADADADIEDEKFGDSVK